ncbi:tyrosine-type recombinase/integrase [Microbacterium sp. IEGM 1404]|uniref:tyrosine-type recombinase/integrase n=1 Tax=Microbacterium sp. IEGM 1404 TaxID=3047084 RepID=UPI0024B6C024|nr:tyrosine-type recombinase/integrase [Microbacterium sp. IEGM 1404]MDI9891937.1 tyrosine-type recombinase/integrase [Microbacterium sp. IEGM 1404]
MNRPLVVEDRWHIAIDHFATAQQVAGIGEATVERRVRHMRLFAESTDLEIEAVTREDFERWVLSRNMAKLTNGNVTDSARAFFRWAEESGRVRVNPLRETERCKPLVAPDLWEPHIQAWERSMRGTGRMPGTIRARGRALRAFAREHGRVSPWDVTTDVLLDYFGSKAWAHETRRGRASAISGFYRWAKDTKRTKKDPTKKLPVMPTRRGVPRPAAEDDVTVALAGADPDVRLAIELASGLGLRCAEVAGLHATNLRERDGLWSLRVLGKGARERVLPVPERLARSLRARGSGFIFPGQVNGHISPHYMSKRVNAALPHGVTMHQLRHRFATLAYEGTRDTFTVQKLLGHASPATTQVYVALSDDTLRDAVESVHAHRGGLARAASTHTSSAKG